MLSTKLKWLLLLMVPLHAWADLTIFDVRKNLPMADSDPIYRDFIINGGSEAGLSVGMVITVGRRLPLYDSYSNRSAGDLQLKVAKIKIIHVQKGMSVARLHSEFTRESTPVLEDNFIMVGDRLDMSTATSGDKKADNGSSGTASMASNGPTPTPSSSQPTAATIVINSVELASKAPVQLPKPAAQPQQKVDLQVLQ